MLPSGDHPRLGWPPYYRERASPTSRNMSNGTTFLHTSQPVSLLQSLTRHDYITGPSYTPSLNGHPSFNCRAWSSVDSIPPTSLVLKGSPWLGSKLPRHESTSCQSCHCMIARTQARYSMFQSCHPYLALVRQWRYAASGSGHQLLTCTVIQESQYVQQTFHWVLP